jgi:predicted Zn-dependent protease with MMP-like domain
MPDRITIFQGPIERMARNREHLCEIIEQTLWHEIAHYFGMDEKQVRSAERRRSEAARRLRGPARPSD